MVLHWSPVEAHGPVHDLWDGDCLRVQRRMWLLQERSKAARTHVLQGMDDGFRWVSHPQGEMTASGLASFPVRDSLEELDLLDPGVRLGRWGIYGSYEPVPVLADPCLYSITSGRTGWRTLPDAKGSLSVPMGIGSFVLMPLALTFTEVLFKPCSPGTLGLPTSGSGSCSSSYSGTSAYLQRKSTTGSSRAIGC